MNKYQGGCHCGALSFAFEHDEINSGLRCNCSICKRKGALMSEFSLAPEEIVITEKNGALGLYQFSTKVAKHYFCKVCGIYPFHQTMRKPGHYRVNLGCIDELDISQFEINIFDGKNI